MRRAPVIAAALVAFALSVPAAAAAPAHVGVSVEQGVAFPQRGLLVTLPPGVHPYDVAVTENGVPVVPHITPVPTARVPLSLVVALDTSDSMRGRPLSAALGAAETLVAHRPAGSDVEVLGFARTPTVLHGWSAGRTFVPTGVAPSAGTAIWDAITLAAQQLDGRPGATRAIVVLTDGHDVSSSATERTAARVALQNKARVFAVGLPGAEQSTGELKDIVARTGGQFVQVTSLDQLQSVYAGLARQLKAQYVITYTSQLRGVGRNVTVHVRVGTATGSQQYVIPPMAGTTRPAPAGWWSSTVALALIAAAVGLIMLLGAYTALRPVPVRASRRLRRYGASEPAGQAAAAVPEMPRRPTTAGGAGLWARFVADVDRGEIGLSAHRVLAGAVVAGTVVAAVVAGVTGVVAVVAAGPLVGAGAAQVVVRMRAAAWYRHFDAVLADHLMVLASSLRAGHSLLQAVSHVADEADEATAREWHEVVRQTRVGVSVEDAMDDMVRRIGNKDLQWIALVARVQHQVGGNMAEMFDIVADTVRQRHRLRAQLHTLTAQGRMTRWILTAAPFAIGTMMFILSPSYMTGFLTDHIGQLLLAAAAVMIALGSLWLKRIVEIEV